MKIELPQVGESVTEGIIGKWLKRVGDRVEKYESLVEVVTDKVNMEMPSPVSGILTSIIAQEDQTVPMGAVIAEIAVDGEEAATYGDAATPPSPAKTSAPQEIDRTGLLLHDVAPVGPTGSGGPLVDTQDDLSNAPEITSEAEVAGGASLGTRHSPAVRRLAEEHAVDLSNVVGTGIGGRVTRNDVQKLIAQMRAGQATETSAAPMAGSLDLDEERVPLTPVRRSIAGNMVKSATLIPQAWTIVEVDVTDLVHLRESLKGDFQRNEGVKITYLAFVVKAVAASLKENPLLNSSWGEDAIILKRRTNIGIAVAARDGLVVPVIHDADALTISGIAKAIDELTTKGRQGTLKLEDVQGGTFTVNNTGALGSVASQPLVNYPQAAILTTEAIVKRPLVISDAIAIRSVMNVCLVFDHRIMDGAEASAFINAVKSRLEAMGPGTTI